MILIISCATMPPMTAEMLCSSPPAALETSWAIWTKRSLLATRGAFSLMEAIISSGDAVLVFDVAVNARKIGIKDIGISGPASAAISSFSSSRSGHQVSRCQQSTVFRPWDNSPTICSKLSVLSSAPLMSLMKRAFLQNSSTSVGSMSSPPGVARTASKTSFASCLAFSL